MKICSCGKIIPDTVKCECKIKADKQRGKLKNEYDAEATVFYKSAKWRKFRLTIIKRDNAHCQRCLIKYNVITTSSLEVHHIKPRSKYPELAFEKTNTICLCKTCNTQLGVQEHLDFKFSFIEEEYNFVL
jgi:hypothetical protein